MLFGDLLIFFPKYHFKKFFQEYQLSVKQFGPRYGRPDLGLNCLQMLSTKTAVARSRKKTLIDEKNLM